MILGLWLMLGVCSLSVHASLLVTVLTYGSGKEWINKLVFCLCRKGEGKI